MTRKYLHFYPEIPDGAIREIWHAQKWRHDMDLKILSPMYDAGHGRHFYVNELAKMSSGELIIPFRWFVQHNELHADAWEVTVNNQVCFTQWQLLNCHRLMQTLLAVIKRESLLSMMGSQLLSPPEISHIISTTSNLITSFQNGMVSSLFYNKLLYLSTCSYWWYLLERAHSWSYPQEMPNPLRELAQGDPLYTSFVSYFADDVSGNRSKS